MRRQEKYRTQEGVGIQNPESRIPSTAACLCTVQVSKSSVTCGQARLISSSSTNKQTRGSRLEVTERCEGRKGGETTRRHSWNIWKEKKKRRLGRGTRDWPLKTLAATLLDRVGDKCVRVIVRRSTWLVRLFTRMPRGRVRGRSWRTMTDMDESRRIYPQLHHHNPNSNSCNLSPLPEKSITSKGCERSSFNY